jgi:hypothetical protein
MAYCIATYCFVLNNLLPFKHYLKVVKQILRHAESFGVNRWKSIATSTKGIAFIATHILSLTLPVLQSLPEPFCAQTNKYLS